MSRGDKPICAAILYACPSVTLTSHPEKEFQFCTTERGCRYDELVSTLDATHSTPAPLSPPLKIPVSAFVQ